MASFWESINVDGEDMKLYVSVPDGNGPFPAVVVIQHQGGVDQFVHHMTQRVASAGYVGVAPELYHRDIPDCQDDAPTRRARLRDVTVIKDVDATVDFLKRHPGVDSERLGIVGFCMGGRAKRVTTSFTPVRTEADRAGPPPGANAGTLTVSELARSPWVARYPEWGQVGKNALLAPRGLMARCRQWMVIPSAYSVACKSVIFPRVASGSQGFRSGACRALIMGTGHNCPNIPPISRGQSKRAP